ncbi:hypothetical protein N7462_007844 [Penicillium macrosclerotiorum]|uniref:uncharacterized protein n=1 Tax=Penicillium macrosclerotiorum TaxID=303699 RepID=UPI00254794AA|nr:uncharacterized protein N7462_007844 [Penicillium macrosclerotiorum]KAJ5679600.1 hypothetical protein N7462_007844 [Penicillium macrosclerotiorum]
MDGESTVEESRAGGGRRGPRSTVYGIEIVREGNVATEDHGGEGGNAEADREDPTKDSECDGRGETGGDPMGLGEHGTLARSDLDPIPSPARVRLQSTSVRSVGARIVRSSVRSRRQPASAIV